MSDFKEEARKAIEAVRAAALDLQEQYNAKVESELRAVVGTGMDVVKWERMDGFAVRLAFQAIPGGSVPDRAAPGFLRQHGTIYRVSEFKEET